MEDYIVTVLGDHCPARHSLFQMQGPLGEVRPWPCSGGRGGGPHGVLLPPGPPLLTPPGPLSCARARAVFPWHSQARRRSLAHSFRFNKIPDTVVQDASCPDCHGDRRPKRSAAQADGSSRRRPCPGRLQVCQKAHCARTCTQGLAITPCRPTPSRLPPCTRAAISVTACLLHPGGPTSVPP